MKTFMDTLKKFFTSSTSTASRKVVAVYVIFRVIAVVNLVNQIIFMQEWGDIFILALTLALFTIPLLVERVFNIVIPNLLELIIIIFIFSSTVLGELGDFYGYIPAWDTALHTLNGFLAAGVGFSLIYLLNKNAEGIDLTPLFLAIVTFCFSMTVGILWEFFEYYADRTMGLDMQKDRIVQVVNSVDLGEENGAVHQVGGIERTIIESRDDSGSTTRTVIEGGYLDIGVRDTMKDLLVNLIGAVVFSVFGYLYAKYDQQKYRFVRNFIPTRRK